MAQIARPDSDIALGSWTPTPASPTTGFDKIDEAVASDADYVSSPVAPAAAAYRFGLSNVTDPNIGTGHIVRYRIRKDQSGGARIDATIRLDENGTQRAAWTHTDIGNTWTTFEQTLTTPEADAIADYTLLEGRAIANQV